MPPRTRPTPAVTLLAANTVPGATNEAETVVSDASNAAATGSSPHPGYIVKVKSNKNHFDAHIDVESDHPVILNDYVLGSGQTNHGDAVVLRGSARIDGVLEGDSVTMAGNLTNNGVVEGDLVVLLGSAYLGTNAEVKGDVVVLGGKLTRMPGAKVDGDVVEMNPANVPGLQGTLDWIVQGLMLGRPFPPGVTLAWIVAGVFLLLYLLLQLMFPHSVEACVETMERQPVTSFFIGLLTKLLVGLISILLMVTVVGIVLTPFLFIALLAAVWFGKLAAYRYVGRQLAHQLRLGFLQSPLAQLVLGALIFYGLYMIPFVGFVAWGFTGLFGLGAVVLTMFNKFRSERRPVPPAPMPGPAPAPTPTPTPAMAMAGVAASAAGAGSEFAAQPSSASEAGAAPAYTPAYATGAAYETTLAPRAGFWIRLAALLLDALLFGIVFAFLHVQRNHWFLLLWFVYHVVLWTLRGATIGDLIMGIQLVRLDGRRVDWATAIVRALTTVLSAFPLGLGFFWAGFSREKQSWHDIVAGTVMVKAPRGMALV